MNDHFDYVMAGGKEGKERLNILAHVLEPYTKELLISVGVAAGKSFLDNGCGGGNVAIMVAELVGENGSVVATDVDDIILTLAKNDSDAKGLKNISFQHIDAQELTLNNTFDFAYCRFLLSHLKTPEEAIEKMKKAVKPGGKVIVEDIDFRGHFCYPANSAFERYIQLYTKVVKSKGADANIGPSLPALFRQAGIKNIHFDTIQPSFQTGEGKWMAYITLEKIRNTIIEAALTDKEETDHLLQELAIFTKDENSIISLPRIFRVWGDVS